jgi:redox-sensitive bicupin YhaK (pirin superfamily)
VIAGKPLNEPIAQYGPFVMNTGDEIRQTLVDYQRGAFEAAKVHAL